MPDSPTASNAAPTSPDPLEPQSTGTLAAAISNAVVGLLHEYTGRGPTRARTTLGPDTIVVTLRDSLTKAERTLAARGQSTEVLAMRRAFQDTMREDLVAVIERLSGRSVEAFLSDNLADPDVAVEIFLLNATGGAAG
ncbi:MAG TPA: DUF2294 domain-containing protein [Solirubrobacteraceae bacterium]|jgi:uncharacterized protein YbcI|nr:DUF2294 domain-containing protein [Solirubrobacteraceae bacterium]